MSKGKNPYSPFFTQEVLEVVREYKKSKNSKKRMKIANQLREHAKRFKEILVGEDGVRLEKEVTAICVDKKRREDASQVCLFIDSLLQS